MTDVFSYPQPAANVPFEANGGGGAALAGSDTAPIGVFDSGAGGLTVLTALLRELPNENYVYFGDTAHCPYGTRSEVEIVELSTRAIRFMVEQGVKLVVVACNTASLAALDTLRATFPVPFVGVVPAVELAARTTKRGRIGIAATNQTAKSPYLFQLIEEFAEGVQVSSVGCPEMVTLVERGILDGPIAEETVRRALLPLLKEDVDVIVLGCTHFPVLRTLIERIAGYGVQVIDSAVTVARRTSSVLDRAALMHPAHAGHHSGQLQVWCSGDPCAFSNVASKILSYPVFARQTWLERELFAVNLCEGGH